jgi:TctA family transporter
MLAGIYYGAQYGDSVSAITMKIPHASSIVALHRWLQMTLKGKTGLALFTRRFQLHRGTVAVWCSRCWPRSWARWRSCSGLPITALSCSGFVCVSFVTTGSLLIGLTV